MNNSSFQSRAVGDQDAAPLRHVEPGKGSTKKFRRTKKVPRRGKKPLKLRLPSWQTLRSWLAWKRLLLGGVGAVLLYLAFVWITLPSIEFDTFLAVQSSTITDRNGVELYRLHGGEDRTIVSDASIPDALKKAIVAIEDERFYERNCIDFRALFRAVATFGAKGGGSTLTRQLARNALDLKSKAYSSFAPLRLVRTLDRKVKEVILGCQMEGEFTKDELLGMYLNWIPFGRNAYGVEQASKLYFGLSAIDLSLAQSVVLAALPQRPTYFSPYGSYVRTKLSPEVETEILTGRITTVTDIPEEGITIGLLGNTFGTGSTTLYVGGRVDQVLFNMQEQGMIEEAERLQALEEYATMEFQSNRESIRAPHFVLWVRDQVEKMFKGQAEEGFLELGGWTIQTTLDWDIQQAAEQVIRNKREGMLEAYGAHNMSLVAMHPRTREILAYVGNMDFNDQEFGGKIDMVQAPRQPGSSFKPIVYAGAFNEGYNPADVIWDVPTKIGDDEPQNFDEKFTGPLPMRNALASSRNIPAAKAFFLAGGEETMLNLAADMGARTPKEELKVLSEDRPFRYGWPLALGAAETPLIEMAEVYATLADEGRYQPVRFVHQITDQQGNILPLPEGDSDPVPILSPRIAFQITSILSDASARPEGYWRDQLSIDGFQTAAKTGTSNKCLEFDDERRCLLRKPDNAWLLGYTPALVAGVWVGNVDSTAMYDRAGGLNTASPIWKDFMQRAHRRLVDEPRNFDAPPGVVSLQVSKLSGQLPTDCTPVEFRQADVFLQERAPTDPDPACAQLTVDKLTNFLASSECPEDAREERSFIIPRGIDPATYPLWNVAVQDWIKEQMELWYATENHSGAVMTIPAAPTEECRLSMTPGREQEPELVIRYPADNGNVSYPSFRPLLNVNVAEGSGIRTLTYFVDDKEVAQTQSGFLAEAIRVPRSLSKTGTHRLRIEAVDIYYNKVEKEVRFRFEDDTSAPGVTLTSPTQRQRIPQGATARMAAEASDSNGGLKHVQFFLNGILLANKPREPFVLDYTFDHPAGRYTVTAKAIDLAGNEQIDSVDIFVGDTNETIDTDSNQPVSGSAPYLRLPSALQGAVGTKLDIELVTPDIQSLGILALRVDVEHQETGNRLEILRLIRGEGAYLRPWTPQDSGTYNIVVIAQEQSGTERVLEEKVISISN